MRGFFSILLALCLLFLVHRLFQPLGQIATASQNMAAGNYTSRLPVSGHDELAHMAQSFNHMAGEIENQIAALQEAAGQKQRFIDNFAHELRTPLTAIYGYAEYLQKALVTEEDKIAASGYIMAECQRLQTMAQQLLELALLRGDTMEQGPVAVANLFDAVQHTMYPQAQAKQTALVYDNQATSIWGNLDLLHSLLINLLDNALKACGTKGTIIVRACQEQNQTILSVQDNGQGMSCQQLSRVKEAFYRGDRARSRKEGGAGLGLAICEEIARCHHSTLQFCSTPGQGTTVKIIFTSSS